MNNNIISLINGIVIIIQARGPLLARQDQGLRFGGGKHWSEAREARFRPTLTGPNPKPQSWLAAVTSHTLTRTLNPKPKTFKP